MWFKKKSVLQAEGHYNSNTAFDGTDWRTANKDQGWVPSKTLPSAADADKYFYLPALGYYWIGGLSNIGASGRYWSSSAHLFSSHAYCLYFDIGFVKVQGYGRLLGYRVDGGFE